MRLVLVVLFAGCGFEKSLSTGDDTPPGDGPPIDQPDAPEGCVGVLATVCPAQMPSAPLTLTAGIIDTSSDPKCQATNTSLDACLIAGTTITVTGTVIGVGTKPLVLWATDTITIMGTLDVASHRGGVRGAGSATGTCNAGMPPTGIGGGQGGSYGTMAGNGGGTGQGIAGAPRMWTGLRGGCDGARGGGNQPMGGTEHGAGGFGGGAVALIATNAINISGTINASGAAGLRSDDTPSPAGGGGGGGSGGTIVLDAPEVSIGGFAFARGGGGAGGGACSTDGSNMANGGDPTELAVGAGGAGNIDGTCVGGVGGSGSGGATGSNGTGGTNGGGGGGGGGGAGILKTTDPTPPGNTSPGFS